MGRSHELPSKRFCILKIRRVEIAEAESMAELRVSSEEDSEVILGGNDNSVEIADETLQIPPTVQSERMRTVDIFRAVEKNNLNTVLTNPNSLRVTDSLIDSIVIQPERVIRFAKRLWHKGKLHPAVAKELGMESRKSTKTSIIEQIQ